MAYRVTGDERYLSIITNAHDYLSARYTYATGGYGPCEKLFGDPGYLGESVLHAQDDGWGHMEVACSSWAVFKLSRYLLEFTGEAKYAAWAEKVLYNCIAAELSPGAGGRIMYYADYYVLGARKTRDDGRTTAGGVTFEWPCCSGTLPEAIAEYANLSWFTGEDGVYVAQFISSDFRWKTGGGVLDLKMRTSYPEQESVRIEVAAGASHRFALHLRKPSWAPSVQVTVNGVEVHAVLDDKGWIRIERTWEPGDAVEVAIPLPLRMVPVDEAHPGIVALACGPVILASTSSGIMAGDVSSPASWIRRDRPDALHYSTVPGSLKVYPARRKSFKPLYEFAEGETYYAYNRIEGAGGAKGTVAL